MINVSPTSRMTTTAAMSATTSVVQVYVTGDSFFTSAAVVVPSSVDSRRCLTHLSKGETPFQTPATKQTGKSTLSTVASNTRAHVCFMSGASLTSDSRSNDGRHSGSWE